MNPNIKRRKSWCEDTEVTLIELWQEKLAQLRGARKNSHVYEEMAHKLKEAHSETYFTAADIKIKIHNMTQRYRKEKGAVGPSGGSPSAWKYYTAVHQILDSCKSINTADLVEDSINFTEYISYEGDDEVFSATTEELSNCSALSTSTPSPPRERSASTKNRSVKNKCSHQQKMVTILERMESSCAATAEEIQKAEEKKIAIMEKNSASLEKYVNDMGEIKNAIVSFFNQH